MVEPTTPGSPPEAGESSELNQDALLYAWAQLSVYDLTASDLKNQYIWRRRLVVILTLSATIASVLTGIAGNEVLMIMLGAIAVALPSIATVIMADVIRFVGTTDWVRNRYIAEMIRMHIFLYRMQAGIYSKEPKWENDDRLGQEISEIIKTSRTETDIPPRVALPKKREETLSKIKSASSLTPADDGLCQPTIDDYVVWRLDHQREWYENRIRKDFRLYKFFFRFAQAFLLFGTLLGFLAGAINSAELVALIAVTNSISASLTLWSDLGLVGKTYGLFIVAANQLTSMKSQWLALQNNPTYIDENTRQAEINKFVVQIEKILEWERKEWREMVLQSQVATDKIVLGDLKRLTSRAESAQEEEE